MERICVQQDLQGEIDKVCKFLGKTLSPEQRSRLLSHLKFDNFAKNAAVNAEDKVTDKTRGSFIRKGIFIFHFLLSFAQNSIDYFHYVN